MRGTVGGANFAAMDLDAILATLRAHEAELRAMGVRSLSVFGSQARREAGRDSDVDLAATLDATRPIGLSGMAVLEERLATLLKRDVDLVGEPVEMKPRLQALIERDRAVAF